MASNDLSGLVAEVLVQSPVLGIYYLTLGHSEDEYHLINYASVVNFCHSQTCVTSDHYLDCCNGLLLLFNPCTGQFCVSNPITRQHVSIPVVSSAAEHDGRNLFCAALAYDPIESNHYRVVRIDFSQQPASSTPSPTALDMDIFSSQYRQWVRHGLQLDPIFIEGFKSFKLCRQFVYLRGVLYSLANSGKLLSVDLNSIKACALELPCVAEDTDDHMGAMMACLGVSMGKVCYVRRESSGTFRFWAYDDQQCESVDRWNLKYSVMSQRILDLVSRKELHLGLFRPVFIPIAISPNSNVVFFGPQDFYCPKYRVFCGAQDFYCPKYQEYQNRVISCYDFQRRKLEIVDISCLRTVVPPDQQRAGFTLRANLTSLYGLDGARNAFSTPLQKGAKVLSAEQVACKCTTKRTESDRTLGKVTNRLSDKIAFCYPNERQLCEEMNRLNATIESEDEDEIDIQMRKVVEKYANEDELLIYYKYMGI
ncbi:hypothetical protein C1H46_010578 [Malus baccata]|uniref:F-box protein At3g26010-like beta-propeller domain-containing protein n=1 Tax=Malus baccata TaxID=106549 RepID=A0A540MYA4_MALBA|nr:hypothetical protein C1H46_010578 [Malus baccata]